MNVVIFSVTFWCFNFTPGFITPIHLKSLSLSTTTKKRIVNSSRRRSCQKDIVRTPTMLSEAFKMKTPRQRRRKASNEDDESVDGVGALKDDLINSNLCLDLTSNVTIQEQEVCNNVTI